MSRPSWLYTRLTDASSHGLAQAEVSQVKGVNFRVLHALPGRFKTSVP